MKSAWLTIVLAMLAIAPGLVQAQATNSTTDYTPRYDADGWEVLFDGKDLNAWDMKGKEFVWMVDPRGELYINSEGHTLFTKKRYCDFVLEMDFKVVAHEWSNSGAFIRVHDNHHEVQTGFEIQILADADYDYKWNNIHATGALYDMVPPSANVCKPPGEWNHFRITANGSMITVELNGTQIVKADLDQWTTPHRNPDGKRNKFPYAMGALPREGFIGLQNHGGLPTYFRNVRVKPLTDRKPIYTGKEPIEQVLHKTQTSAPAAAAWGAESLAQIRRSFYMPKGGYFAEEIGKGQTRHPAWLWDASVQLSALTAAARSDPDMYLPALRAYAKALRTYRTENHGLPGLDVNPGPKKPDRYYDDNAWIVLSLLEAYNLTHDLADLKLATDAFNFVMSGKDDSLGGGIYWHEDRKDRKHACSCGPAMLDALEFYKIKHDDEDLAIAKSLYAWTQKHLEDSDGLVFDSIRVSDGSIARAKFSYNSATQMRAGAMLYEITKDQAYLKEAERIAAASEKKWVDSESGIFIGNGKFGHKLMEGFLEVYNADHNPHWLGLCTRCAITLHSHRAPNGWYPRDWQESPPQPIDPVRLIDQSSAARAFWLVAAYGTSFGN